jgi:hypothetical protein
MSLARLPALLCSIALSLALSSCSGGGGGASCSGAAEGTTCGSGLACFGGSCLAAAPLTIRWSFLRHVVPPLSGDVAYDVSPAPTAATGACLQSGADTIAITDSTTGKPIDPAAPAYACALEGGVQSVTLPALQPGSHDLTITGFQGTAAAYQSRNVFDVVAGAANAYDVVLPGIQDDLDILVQFWNSTGVNLIASTCNHAAVQTDTFQFTLHDRNGVLVASSTIPCPLTANQSLIQLREQFGTAIDRDTYTARVRALAGTLTLKFDSASRNVTPDCHASGFQHAGADTFGVHAWTMKTFSVLDDLTAVCPL